MVIGRGGIAQMRDGSLGMRKCEADGGMEIIGLVMQGC